MARAVFDAEGIPTTPGAGVSVLRPDSTTKRWTSLDETGKHLSLPPLHNFNSADVVANAADTYLSGSDFAVPAWKLQVGTLIRWRFAMTKTAAGVAGPAWNVRVGTNGNTSDTARLTFTGVAQTAATDTGLATIEAIVRAVGASGVMAGIYRLEHNLATTGLSNQSQPNIIQATSASFDTTVAGLKIGVSCNPGASGVWTFQLVSVEVLGL